MYIIVLYGSISKVLWHSYFMLFSSEVEILEENEVEERQLIKGELLVKLLVAFTGLLHDLLF